MTVEECMIYTLINCTLYLGMFISCEWRFCYMDKLCRYYVKYVWLEGHLALGISQCFLCNLWIKVEGVLPWPMLQPSTKVHGNKAGSFYLILLTNKPHRKHNPLGRGNNVRKIFKWITLLLTVMWAKAIMGPLLFSPKHLALRLEDRDTWVWTRYGLIYLNQPFYAAEKNIYLYTEIKQVLYIK